MLHAMKLSGSLGLPHDPTYPTGRPAHVSSHSGSCPCGRIKSVRKVRGFGIKHDHLSTFHVCRLVPSFRLTSVSHNGYEATIRLLANTRPKRAPPFSMYIHIYER